MNFSFDDAFNQSMCELEKYAALHKQAKSQGSEPPVLKLVMVHGQPQLKTLSKQSMNVGERVASRMGWGGYRLDQIVRYLLSKSFESELEKRALSPTEHAAILSVARQLDVRVEAHNRKPGLFGSKIEVERKTVVRSLTAHIRALSERADTVASHVFNPASNLESNLAFKRAPPEILPAPRAPREPMQVRLQRWKEAAPRSPAERQALFQEVAQEVQRELVQDTKEGKIVFDSQGNLVSPLPNYWFGPAMKLCEALVPKHLVEARFSEIVNRAIQHQELRKVHQWCDNSWGVECKVLMEEYCSFHHLPSPSKEAIVGAQKEALQQLFSRPVSFQLSPRDFRGSIYSVLIQSYWKACGVPDQKIGPMHEAYMGLLEWRSRAYELVEKLMVDVNQELKEKQIPDEASKLIAGKVRYQLIEMLDKTALRHVQASMRTDLHPGVWRSGLRKLTMASLQKQLSAIYKKETTKQIAFYQKWKGHIEVEMVQGFHDLGEILGEGVCGGLARRWILEALQQKEHTASQQGVQEARFDDILTEDRTTQAAGNLASSGLGSLFDRRNLAERGLLKSSERLSTVSVSGRSQIKRRLIDITSKPDFQSQFQGIASIYFANHVVVIQAQKNEANPSLSRFEFSDANFGRFVFPVVQGNADAAFQQCLECLTELIATFYGEKHDYLDGRYYYVKTPSQVLKVNFDLCAEFLTEKNRGDREMRSKLLESLSDEVKLFLAKELRDGMLRLDIEGKIELPDRSHWYQHFLELLPKFAEHCSAEERDKLQEVFRHPNLNEVSRGFFRTLNSDLLTQAKTRLPLVELLRQKAIKECFDYAQKVLKVELALGGIQYDSEGKLQVRNDHWLHDCSRTLTSLNMPAVDLYNKSFLEIDLSSREE